jgi:glycosyltransferase involved in cell wall biosynthesis
MMDQPQTILFLETGTQDGGSFVVLMTLVRQMDRRLFRPVIVCFNRPRCMAEFEALGVPVTVLSDPLFSCRPAWLYLLMRVLQRAVTQFVPAVRFWYEPLIHLRAARSIQKIIREEAVDLLVLNTQVNRDLFAVFLAEKAGVPVAAHLQSCIGRGLTPALAGRVNRTVRRMIANSEACRTYWNGLGLERIDVLYHAMTTPDAAPADLKDLFGVPPGAPVVCCVGRLIHIKGQDVLLRAFARLDAQYANAVLLLVGDGKRRQALEKLAARLGLGGRVVFTGWRSDACSLIAAADVLVLPSREEPLGLTLLEGMAVGTPVIGCRTGGMPEIVDPEVNGLLVDSGDPDGLAAAIGRLLSDAQLRARLIPAGRKTVAEKFSPASFVRDVEAVYRAVLEETS